MGNTRQHPAGAEGQTQGDGRSGFLGSGKSEALPQPDQPGPLDQEEGPGVQRARPGFRTLGRASRWWLLPGWVTDTLVSTPWPSPALPADGWTILSGLLFVSPTQKCPLSYLHTPAHGLQGAPTRHDCNQAMTSRHVVSGQPRPPASLDTPGDQKPQIRLLTSHGAGLARAIPASADRRQQKRAQKRRCAGPCPQCWGERCRDTGGWRGHPLPRK